MGPREPAIDELAAAELEGALAPIERVIRPGVLRTGLVPAPFPLDFEIRSQPELRVLVRDDLRAGLAQTLVGTRVVPVPMRIEQRGGRLTGVLGDRLQQIAGTLRDAAVDHHQTVRTVDDDDVAAGA